jgi:hypothetical protein
MKKRLNSQKVGWFEDMKRMDLSHWGPQHIDVSGRFHRGYRPILTVTKGALRTLGSVALSSPMAGALYAALLVS